MVTVYGGHVVDVVSAASVKFVVYYSKTDAKSP